MMTPRERVEAALLRRPVDKIPFLVSSEFLPRCETERRLRNEGVCVVSGRPLYKVVMPDVKTYAIHHAGEDGENRVKTVYETPFGTVSALDRPVEFTSWHEERIFRRPEDYRAIEFLIRNRRYQPDYGPYLEARQMVGNDVFLLGFIGYSPLLEIIYVIMGLERFSFEWADNRDEVMRLYDALTEDRRKRYRIAADSPMPACQYCGNVSAKVVGVKRFEEYVVPHYDEFSEVMHKQGKLVGVHLDADTAPLARAVARSQIDFIQAFTPLPTGDMSVAEARQLWPDKALWINFPSTVHVFGAADIEETTRQILEEAAPGDGFLVGITEDVPPDRWQESFSVISRTIDQYGRYPIRSS